MTGEGDGERWYGTIARGSGGQRSIQLSYGRTGMGTASVADLCRPRADRRCKEAALFRPHLQRVTERSVRTNNPPLRCALFGTPALLVIPSASHRRNGHNLVGLSALMPTFKDAM
jgi:hypothetical protein